MNKKVIFTLICNMLLAVVACSDSKQRKVIEDTNKICPISLGNIGEMTSMKIKLLVLIFALLAMVPELSAQSMTVAQIEKNVSELNAKLPVNMGDGLIFERMTVEDGYVVSYSKAPAIDKATQENTKGDQFVIQARKSGVRSMYADYMNAGLGAKQIIRFMDTGKSFTLSFSAQELRRMMSYPADSYKDVWDFVKSMRNGLPKDVGSGLTLSRCYCTMDEVVISYDCDPNVWSAEKFHILQQGFPKRSANDLAGIANGTSDMTDVAKLTIPAGFGFTYEYCMKGQQPARLSFSYEQLAEALGVTK